MATRNNIEGKVVVITGASGGLGEASARLLADQGAAVVLGARRWERIEALSEELTFGGRKALAVATDVTRREEVKTLVDTAVRAFGRIDVLLNSAGLTPSSRPERLRIEDWDRMIDVNLKGVLYGIAAALPHMQAQKSGQIINVSSAAASRAGPGGAVYSAAKQGVRALSESLRQEVKSYNIRTTIISPGGGATDLADAADEPGAGDNVKRVRPRANPADSFARMVAFAINQPADVNEVVFRPTARAY